MTAATLADDPLRRVRDLPAARGSRQGSGAQFTARCPAHDDRNPSLSVGLGRDGAVLVKCHAGAPCELGDILEPSTSRPATCSHHVSPGRCRP